MKHIRLCCRSETKSASKLQLRLEHAPPKAEEGASPEGSGEGSHPLVGLCIRDLVDDQSHTTLGDDVGNAVTDLNGDNRLCSVNAKHGEQVHNRICTPTDHGHHLGNFDLVLDDYVGLTVRCSRKTDEELKDNVQEETHRQKPTDPTWS